MYTSCDLLCFCLCHNTFLYVCFWCLFSNWPHCCYDCFYFCRDCPRCCRDCYFACLSTFPFFVYIGYMTVYIVYMTVYIVYVTVYIFRLLCTLIPVSSGFTARPTRPWPRGGTFRRNQIFFLNPPLIFAAVCILFFWKCTHTRQTRALKNTVCEIVMLQICYFLSQPLSDI